VVAAVVPVTGVRTEWQSSPTLLKALGSLFEFDRELHQLQARAGDAALPREFT
jgi:hypothetical protein